MLKEIFSYESMRIVGDKRRVQKKNKMKYSRNIIINSKHKTNHIKLIRCNVTMNAEKKNINEFFQTSYQPEKEKLKKLTVRKMIKNSK